MKKLKPINHLLVSGLLLVVGMTRAQTQLDDNLVISVSDPRPLAQAAQVLQSKLGVAISYEDIAWAYEREFARAADTPWGKDIARVNPRFRAVIPVGGSLEIGIPIDRVSKKPIAPVGNILQDLIDGHKARGNPGEFRLVTLGTDFSIVPSAARDRTGTMISERSPLDLPISFPEAERSGLETLKAICEAITIASGQNVRLGTIPLNLFTNTMVQLGANSQKARDVVVKAFRDLRWTDPGNLGQISKLSWRLLYGPEERDYILNVRGVEREVVDPTGTVRLFPVAR